MVNTAKESLRELLKNRIAPSPERGKKSASTQPLPPIKKAEDKENYPLSTPQKGFFIQTQMDATSTAYNLPIVLKIVGNLDIEKLKTAFRTVIERHEALRTYFTFIEDQPRMIIEESPSINIGFSRIDVDELKHFIASWVQPFDIFSPSLVRMHILQIDRETYYICIDMHHIISDAKSLSILIREFSALYLDKPLPPVDTQYRDFIVWQENLLSSSHLSSQKSFWENQLKGPVPPLKIPHASANDLSPPSQGKHHYFSISQEQTARLRSLAHREHVTLHMLLLTLYCTFLHHHTTQEEMIIGIPSEGRVLPELKDVIGVFINTLPVRLFPNGNKSFITFLHEVQESVLQSYNNQLFPVDEVQRNDSFSPLFQTYFDLHKAERATIQIDNLSIESLPINHLAAKFNLALEAIEHSAYLELFFEYNDLLFPIETIDTLTRHFLRLIDAVTSDPSVSLGSVPLTLPIEQKLHKADLSFPLHLPFQDLFSESAKTFGSRIAAEDSSGCITYTTLDIITDVVAFNLQKEGIGPEDVVAVSIERSINLLIALISIFKAGATYLPVDPNAPTSRTSEILQMSQAKLILSQENLSFEPKTLSLDKLKKKPEGLISSTRLPSTSLAYVIFTSGSTGKPKGVMVTHRGMVNHLYAKIQDMLLTKDDIVAQTASQTFDVSIWQFLAALLIGGKVDIFTLEASWSPHILLKELQKKRITIFETVPSHMLSVIDEIDQKKYPLHSLKHLILNGEALHNQLCKKWFQAYPYIPIINAYGPTECSDDVCHYFIKSSFSQDNSSVPIGTMIANTDGYILNTQLQISPQNVPGEFYISGEGLARGYIGRADLTAAAFIPSPFSKNGNRLYKTRDLVVYNDDEVVEYFGRTDRQVKIDGVRIELEEIERTIQMHQSIAKAVVLLDKVLGLIAYVIPQSTPTLESIDITNYLSKILPSTMVPKHCIFLKHFPLNSSGKVDTKALPLPLPKKETKRAPPLTKTEKVLIMLWQKLLKVPHVLRSDHFFNKGGSSLLAIQLASQIKKQTRKQLSLQHIFEHPYLKDLAKTIDAMETVFEDDDNDTLPPIEEQRENRHLPFPLTKVQHAYWMGRQGIFSLGNVSVHIYGEYLTKNIDFSRLEKGLNQLVHRHEALRLVFPGDGTQKILEKVPYYKIQVVDLSSASSDEINKQITNKRNTLSHEVFDANKWPLFTVEAMLLPCQEARLYLSFDALVFDGWSVNTLAMEWKTFYDQPNTVLPPLEVSFRDYVLAYNSLETHPQFLKARKYWLSRVEQFPLAPPLPKRPMPPSAAQTFARCTQRLEKSLWKTIQSHLQTRNIAPTAFIAATFAEVLAKFSGSNHFALNLTLFDRLPLHPQINDILGDFTSVTLLEVDRREPQKNFCARARKIQTQLWRDLDNHLYSGINFLQDLASLHQDAPEGSLMPVVLTSILGVEDNDMDIERFLGKEVFGISQTPQVWLDYKAYEVEGNLVVEWDYVQDLFPPDFIKVMHQEYIDLLHRFANSIHTWDEKNLVNIPEAQKNVRMAVNSTSHSFDFPNLLHFLFYKSVDIYPKNLAIIDGSIRMTYRELADISSYLASKLCERGAKQNSLVAIVMDKGWEQIAAVLGILSAGAGYLPIDASLPPDRIALLLELGNSSLALVQEKHLSKVQALQYIKNLPHDSLIVVPDIQSFDKHNTIKPEISNTPSDIAYVIFTSGSTGTPKGVTMQHGAVANTILDINSRFNITEKDRILALSNLNFDLSVYDIFGMLASGGTIVLPNHEKAKDPSHFVELIAKDGVTVWNSVPTFMNMLVEYVEGHQSSSPIQNALRLVLLSGDWVPVPLISRLKKAFAYQEQPIQTVSLGGATEAAIWSIAYDTEGLAANAKTIPYGKPLRNQQFHVLDGEFQPCPDWVAGELFIGGAGLAKGYWQDEEKTAASFITTSENKRIYKTGDYGRYLPDGNIEFLGRFDRQIKLNGHRIELGEIESSIEKHPDVARAVVIHHKQHKPPLIAAYFTPKQVIETFEEVPLIQDPIERFEFKLNKNNLRSFPQETTIPLPNHFAVSEEKYFERKSYRTFTENALSLDRLIALIDQSLKIDNSTLKRTNNTLDIPSLSKLLSPMRGISTKHQPLPKFLYASAGSLYPVQTYVLVKQGAVSGINDGIYYYHPIDHKLNYVTALPDIEDLPSLSIMFAGDLSAIEPLYPSLALPFCYLEAGYMQALLEQQSKLLDIELTQKTLSEKFTKKTLPLLNAPSLKILQWLSMEPPKEMVGQEKLPSIYLYLKQSTPTNAKGWYHYCPEKNEVEKMHINVPFHLSLAAEGNYAIFHKSSIALLFLEPGSPPRAISDNPQLLIQSGRISHFLMDLGVAKSIGGTPIGTLDQRGYDLLQKAVPDGRFIQGFFCGEISKEQINTKGTSNSAENTLVENVRETLSDLLPSYMIPKSLVAVEKFPMTSNGKIDQKALSEMALTNVGKTFTPPKSKLEKYLASIWIDILSLDPNTICIDTNFFAFGGNSIGIVKMFNQIKKQYPQITIEKLFTFTTIRSLSSFLEQKQEIEIDIDTIDANAAKLRKKRLQKRREH